FQHALDQPSLITQADRLLYAQALVRANRPKDAIAQLDEVAGPLAAQAGYQRARVLLASGSADAVRAALRDVVSRYPGDTVAASSALCLLADLSTDDGNDLQAAAFYRQLYSTYPSSARASSARFDAAIIAFAAGDARLASSAFDSLDALQPKADDAVAAR